MSDTGLKEKKKELNSTYSYQEFPFWRHMENNAIDLARALKSSM